MSSKTYSVVEATRTENGKVRQGWIVERANAGHHCHASILFTTVTEAEAELERLKAIDRNSPAF